MNFNNCNFKNRKNEFKIKQRKQIQQIKEL